MTGKGWEEEYDPGTERSVPNGKLRFLALDEAQDIITGDGGQRLAPPGGEWKTYRKQTATWAVKVPVDITVRTMEGEVEAKGGDYLCIDAEGNLYPCDADVFETMYEEVEHDDL